MYYIPSNVLAYFSVVFQEVFSNRIVISISQSLSAITVRRLWPMAILSYRTKPNVHIIVISCLCQFEYGIAITLFVAITSICGFIMCDNMASVFCSCAFLIRYNFFLLCFLHFAISTCYFCTIYSYFCTIVQQLHTVRSAFIYNSKFCFNGMMIIHIQKFIVFGTTCFHIFRTCNFRFCCRSLGRAVGITLI